MREEKVITLQDAIRRMSGLPATDPGLDHRGLLKEGYFADVVVFDPKTIADKAAYEAPHQYAVGMKQVFVNGVQVIRNGEHTGAKPGRALCGSGKNQVSEDQKEKTDQWQRNNHGPAYKSKRASFPCHFFFISVHRPL